MKINKTIDTLEEQNSSLVELLQIKEIKYFEANRKLIKLNALLEQKMVMIEQSLKEVKEERNSKEKECKDLLYHIKHHK
jgi:hypothetical protein